MKIYCARRPESDELARRNVAYEEYEAAYKQYIEDQHNYMNQLHDAYGQLESEIASKLGIDQSIVEAHGTRDSLRVTLNLYRLDDYANRLPSQPIAPRRPDFNSDSDKETNRKLLTRFFKDNLWVKVKYINRAGGHTSTENYYIHIRSMSDTGKTCYAQYMTDWSFENFVESDNYFTPTIRKRDFNTGNLEIVYPITVYTQDEVKEIFSKSRS